MIAVLNGPTAKQQNEWHQELTDWGLPIPKTSEETTTHIELWQENAPAIEWWFSLPQFLHWHNGVCLGMDVQAVVADQQLSQQSHTTDDYQRLKTIAVTVTEHLNQQKTASIGR